MSLDIVLASGSESRRRVLSAAGVDARAVRPNVDEDAAKAAMRAEGRTVRDQASALAELKAVKVSQSTTGLVIGGDQMLSLSGEAFDKPADRAGARRHLEALSGQAHTLETALAVAEEGRVVWRVLTRPKLVMRPLSAEFIERYLDQEGEAILATVGAYRLEGLGAQLFTAVEGDYFSILGLPLLQLLDYLRVRGAIPA